MTFVKPLGDGIAVWPPLVANLWSPDMGEVLPDTIKGDSPYEARRTIRTHDHALRAARVQSVRSHEDAENCGSVVAEADASCTSHCDRQLRHQTKRRHVRD